MRAPMEGLCAAACRASSTIGDTVSAPMAQPRSWGECCYYQLHWLHDHWFMTVHGGALGVSSPRLYEYTS